MIDNKKLIIWDFDGVIAETETLWTRIWLGEIKKRYGVIWDFDSAHQFLSGLSVKSKIKLSKEKGVPIDDNFEEEYLAIARDEMEGNIFLTKDIEDILGDKNIKQCVATGGTTLNTFKKIEVLKLEEYFTKENVFTAEMVEKGKPAPDVFLYAAKQMGTEPKDCVIVEDGKAGIIAAIEAKIDFVVFTEHILVNKEEFITWAKSVGATRFADNVDELKKILYK